jgi:hypothetical protein
LRSTAYQSQRGLSLERIVLRTEITPRLIRFGFFGFIPRDYLNDNAAYIRRVNISTVDVAYDILRFFKVSRAFCFDMPGFLAISRIPEAFEVRLIISSSMRGLQPVQVYSGKNDLPRQALLPQIYLCAPLQAVPFLDILIPLQTGHFIDVICIV